VSQWVGTDDTPSSGEWSPSNNGSPCNMIQVGAWEYDNGGVGDGNLTKVTQKPGGSAADRVTNSYFDWRDRLVAVKKGVETNESTSVHRPIFYYTLDNLGEVTRTLQFDGDGVSISSTTAMPQPPS